MTVIYKLLDNGTGVLLTRTVGLIASSEEALEVFIEQPPAGATVIFDLGGGKQCFRKPEAGKCFLPVALLYGEIRVTVAVFDGSATPPKWICDALKVVRHPKGGVIVAPNDQNLPQEILRLRLENEAMRAENKRLSERMDEFDAWRERLMEGYDIT